MTTAVALPDNVTAEASSIVSAANAIAINDDISYAEAGEFQRAAKQLKSKIADFFDPLVQKAHEAHKALTAARAKELEPINAAIETASRKMGAYQLECERQRREEEAILRKQAEEAAKEEAEATAEYHELMGNTASAEAVRAYADHGAKMAANAVTVEAYAPKVDGQAARTNWKFEVVDATKVPREYLTPDLVAIGAIVRARKGCIEIPGVRVFPEHKVTVRG